MVEFYQINLPQSTMSLNIKNKETCKLARELAELTNDTVTGAITKALRERLEFVHNTQNPKDLIKRMMAFGERAAEHLQPVPSAIEHGDYLYDEIGLPK